MIAIASRIRTELWPGLELTKLSWKQLANHRGAGTLTSGRVVLDSSVYDDYGRLLVAWIFSVVWEKTLRLTVFKQFQWYGSPYSDVTYFVATGVLRRSTRMLWLNCRRSRKEKSNCSDQHPEIKEIYLNSSGCD